MASAIVSMQFISANESVQLMGRGGLAFGSSRFFSNITLLQTRQRTRLVAFTIRAGNRKKKRNTFKGVTYHNGFGFRNTSISKLASSARRTFAVLEGYFLLAWVASLMGMLPGSGPIFTAADDIVSLIMKLNFVLGLYSLMLSYNSLSELPPYFSRKLKLKQPGVFDVVRSTAVGFLPLVNVFLWFRFARKQKRWDTKLDLLANALVYEYPKLFALLLIVSGGSDVFQQVFLMCETATVCGALHRVMDEVRVRNEKGLLDVATEAVEEMEMRAEQQKRIDRLQKFDKLLALTSSPAKSGLSPSSDKVKDWTVEETMEWLGQQGLARYATAFAENSIDGERLLELTNNQLRDDLKVLSFDDRNRLCLLIQQLKKT